MSSGGSDKSRPPHELEAQKPGGEELPPAETTLVVPIATIARKLAPGPKQPAGMQEAPVHVGAGSIAEVHAPWLLESLTTGGKHLRRMLIYPLPFRIGRAPGLELVLPSQQVSKQHAEIYEESGSLRVRDLKSTNGTFVNRNLVDDFPIREGDVLHFADFEFRVARQETHPPGDAEEGSTAVLGDRPLPHQFSAGTQELKELLAQGSVTSVFQPIVRIPDRNVVAYEALGRGTYPGLPEDPIGLFGIAETLGVEAELSRLFRRKAVELVRSHGRVQTLFLNTHAAELGQPGLVESLQELRVLCPHVALILEIHESALALPTLLGELQGRLAKLQIGLAYDDFGAGQARLIELAEVPPNFLKFDRRFVSGIDQAPLSKRRLLASLVAAARELGVETVAEGAETESEAESCRRAGFTHAQGFFFGAPLPVGEI